MHVQCFEDGRFYRDPDRAKHKMWSAGECARYYLCLEGEVFEFKCSAGLLFDVKRQICDFKLNIDNCDITAGMLYGHENLDQLIFEHYIITKRLFLEATIPKPLLQDGQCTGDQLACGDGTCLPSEYFCDGSIDCPDTSDEGWCDANHDPNAASPCDPRTCELPNCFCSRDGTLIPGRLDPSQVPQMITLTFDDAINFENWDLYTQTLFTPERKNPNGCPIRATFYVSHQYTDYAKTQKLWNDGHEIAVHSIT